MVFMVGPDKGLNRFNKTGTITLNLTTDNLQATIAAVNNGLSDVTYDNNIDDDKIVFNTLDSAKNSDLPCS